MQYGYDEQEVGEEGGGAGDDLQRGRRGDEMVRWCRASSNEVIEALVLGVGRAE